MLAKITIFALQMNKNKNIYQLTIEDLVDDGQSVKYIDSDFMIMDNLKTNTQLSIIKLGINVFSIVINGKMQACINGHRKIIEEHQMMVCPSSSIIEDLMISPDFKCIIICLTDRLLKTLLHSYTSIWNTALYVKKYNQIELKEKDINVIEKVIDILKIYISDDDLCFREDIIHSLIQTLLLNFCSTLKISCCPDRLCNQMTSAENLFNGFIDILSKSEIKRHPITFYSDRLFISSRYLSSICRSISGKSAGKWIQDYLNDDINYQLLSTDMNMKSIAVKCGFPSISLFDKYVKLHFGMSPQRYRNDNRDKK
jgi:AraC family transcriptional regulator, transcriptional activator of pobA